MPDQVKIDRFKKALAESEFDVIVASSLVNTWYLSEVIDTSQIVLPDRLALVVWAKGRDPIHIVATNEEVQARKEGWIRDIRGYVEYKESPMQFLATALKELGATRSTIGIDKRSLTVHYHEQLTNFLPNLALKDAEPFFDRVRAMKSAEEIQRLEDAAQITDRAIRKAFETVRPGITEKSVGILQASELVLGGAEIMAFQILGAGVNSITTFGRAGDYVLKSGDLMRTDVGGIFPKGYCSDQARIISVGKPSNQQRENYKSIWEEHERLIAMLRPGTVCADVFNSHKQRWEKKGWPMVRPHIGHGIGVGHHHEYPVIRPGELTVLEPGMCINIEPNHTIPGVERCQAEDMVLITETGPRVLSRSADWAQLFEPGM